MQIIKNIFSVICLTVSLFLFIYVFYKSEIYWNGEKKDFYSIYYIITSILIFFSIITFILNQKIKRYLSISIISILIGLYIFEGYLNFKQHLADIFSIK